MCAATAGYRGRKVLVVDHANKVGKKILMSGGGRCNFTNLSVEPQQFISANPHFCKSALSRFTSEDFIELVDRHGLAYHEKTKGQLFCDNKAQDILNILLTECEYAGVEIKTHCSIDKLARQGHGFCLTTSRRNSRSSAIKDTDTSDSPVELECDSLVIATGGLSIPTMGATGFGYQVAKQFDVQCTTTDAALVPFVLQGQWLTLVKELAGVSLEVEVRCEKQSFKEALLFTHKGLSGPAILQISNYWHRGKPVSINFLPQIDLETELKALREQANKSDVKNAIAKFLPKRFVQQWLGLSGIDKAVNQLSDKDIHAITQLFQSWLCEPSGTEGYKTAEVTRGGVDTNEVSSKTFEAKKVPGLYFIGEVLDVTGWLGGFNFQWAWASGYCAGQVI